MAKFYLAVPDSFTIPTDGNQIALSSACILRRDDSAVPTFLPLDADGYTVFIADTGDTATATAFAISSTSPTDNATDVAVDTAITITFNANIAFGTGNITLRDNDGGWADLEAFDVTTDTGGGAGTVSISGAVLTIEPTADLANSIEYAIRIDATAIDTTDGVSFAGIADDTSISFTTVAAATAPGTMSAPTVTAVSDTEISVDRAAAPSDGGSAILSYDLRWEVDGSGSWTTVAGITDPQSVTGLTAATLYNVQTRAVNAVDAGAWSASGSATTDAASGVSFTDTFSYTDGTLLNTLTSTYSTIYSSGAGTEARGGVAKTVASAGGNGFLYIGDTVSADQYAEVTIGAPGSDYGDQGFIIVRGTDDANRLWLILGGGVISKLAKKVAGATTNFATLNTSIASGSVIRVEVTGNDCVVKLNGTPIFTLTDDADLGGTLATGKPGLQLVSAAGGYTTGVTFDQFKCGDL